MYTQQLLTIIRNLIGSPPRAVNNLRKGGFLIVRPELLVAFLFIFTVRILAKYRKKKLDKNKVCQRNLKKIFKKLKHEDKKDISIGMILLEAKALAYN